MGGEKFETKISNVVDELKSTKIWKRLNVVNPQRADRAVEFVKFIEPYLNSIHNYFPLYTRHDCHHSYQVLRRMGEITINSLYEDGNCPFSYDELFILIIAAYAHDVGMVLFEDDEERTVILNDLNLSKDIELTNEVLTSYLRRNHAERGIRFLRKEELKYIIPEYITGIAGGIMEGHNLSPDVLVDKLPNIAALSGDETNPISLSIILCCADALEFSDTRVIASALEEAKLRSDDIAAQYSQTEMMKHVSVGCGISITEKGLIIASGEFKDAKVLHATHQTLDQIEGWLRDYILYDKLQHRSVLRLNNNTIYRDSFTTDSFIYHPVAIKMDELQIREILTSKNMWGNSECLPIKELVQNSIDACRYRMHIKPVQIQYEPKINITISNEDRTIRISDNGIGMSEDDVLSYFLQMGKSRTRSAKFIGNEINKGFSSLARYGIGFWSVFSIARSAKVQTVFNSFYEKKSSISFDVKIEPLVPYMEIRECSITEGTLVEVELKDEIDITRIIDELVRAISVSPIDISIVNEKDEVIYSYPNKLHRMSHKDIFGYRADEAKSKGVEVFDYFYDDDEIEISLGISYTEINGEFRCLTPDGNSIFNLVSYDLGISALTRTSVCGLATAYSFGEVPFAIERVGVMVVNIKSPEGLEFSLSRRSLIENEKYNEIQRNVTKRISEALYQFYEKLNIFNNARGMQILINDSRSNGGGAGDNRKADLYKHYVTHYVGIVPVDIVYWEKQGEKVSVDVRSMLLEEFWNIKDKVYYACIWPDNFDNVKKKSFINAVLNTVKESKGFILWAYHEALSLVEVAKKTKVINSAIPYKDWHADRNQLIVMEPKYGYVEKDDILFKISSRWSGNVIRMDFDNEIGTRPWYNFGRSIMYVDENHPLIKYIISLVNEGKMWECGDLLALMSATDTNVNDEIYNRTGIKAVY